MLSGTIAWLGCLTVSVVPAYTQSAWRDSAALPAHALERQLIVDCRDGRLDDHNLLTAALIAGGVSDPQQLADHQDKFAKQLRRILGSTATDDEATRAEHLLTAMHEELLTGEYLAACSNVADLVSHGNYNCVSATVVYQILCEASGLNVQPIAVPAHVFSRLAKQGIDVQTTCPVWLGAGKGRRSTEQTTTGRASNAGDSGEARGTGRRTLDNVQLLGKIYYNRGVLALQDSDFAEAVRVLRISRILDGEDAIAKNNLLAALNNWGLSESQRGRFATASELLCIGRALDPDYAPLRANDLHIHQRWVQSLCRERRFSLALGILEDGLRRRPDAKLFDEGRYIVLQLWARDLWERNQLDAGFALFHRTWDDQQLDEALVVAATHTAADLSATVGPARAMRIVERARSQVADPRLDRLAKHLSAHAE